jgi:hypothetical protein
MLAGPQPRDGGAVNLVDNSRLRSIIALAVAWFVAFAVLM